ncbi:hypothetical protein BC829DRAFT_422453 [Chytridium lagenaria]|nr:hypothetical protein BC829DRAFT_422453 [Chytridium lagenaria]
MSRKLSRYAGTTSTTTPITSGKRKAASGDDDGDHTVIIVDYSEKALGIFGDTIQIKDKLKELNARFNKTLTHNGERKAGWVMQKARKAELVGWLKESNIPVHEEEGASKKAKQDEKKEEEVLEVPSSGEEAQPHYQKPVPIPTPPPPPPPTPPTNGIEIIELKDGNLAAVGNTKAYKDVFEKIKASLSLYIEYYGTRKTGWTFPKEKRQELENAVGLDNIFVRPLPLTPTEPAAPIKVHQEVIIPDVVPPLNQKVFIVDYSDKSIAIFGDTISIKDKLKTLGARFNRYLSYAGGTKAGWIISTKFRKSVEEVINALP